MRGVITEKTKALTPGLSLCELAGSTGDLLGAIQALSQLSYSPLEAQCSFAAPGVPRAESLLLRCPTYAQP